MEPAQPKLTHIHCAIHEKEIIRKVGINSQNLCILCADCCLEGKHDRELYPLESFLKQIAQGYSKIPKLKQLPESTCHFLNTENEIVASFSQHIEKEKEKVNMMFDKLRQSVYQKLETKKRQLIASLEAQVKAFEDVLSYYKQSVSRYHQQEHAINGQELAVTLESLYKEISKITKAGDLKKLLETHYEVMKNNVIFTKVTEDKGKKIVMEAIEIMDVEFMKIQTLKPVISFGVNNESFEETLKKWNEQVETTINGLKFDVRNPVRAIKLELVSLQVDSEILKKDFESIKMIVDWVQETTKSKICQTSLLYRGSRDGFEAKDFHAKCDHKGPTIVLVENTAGYKFGGYASVSWTSYGGEIKTQESFSSFLFSVDKKQKLLYRPESNLKTLHHDAWYGPIFGYGSALIIFDRCNITNRNYSDPYSYENLKGGGYISGDKYFIVKEIEVYSIALH